MPDSATSTQGWPSAITSSTAVNYIHHVRVVARKQRNWKLWFWQGLFTLWAVVAFRRGWVGFDSHWNFYIR